ncbi:MAG: nucleotide exchange factor GrpE [Clostridia bacterium]|nr:nucleotide exchange factor GrpE [Clostridia bacterium]
MRCYALEEKETKECEAEVTAEQTEETVELSEIEQLQRELAAQKDLLLRTAAEYDNFKKRTQREKEELSAFTKCSVMKDLLPALDNLDRASGVGVENPDEYKKGIDMIMKSLFDALTKLGLQEIEAEGKEFDPNFHYAISKIEDENLGENMIAQVFQKGYMMGETVIRPAMVVVANCN